MRDTEIQPELSDAAPAPGGAGVQIAPAGETLEGTIETIVYRSEETGFTVCSVKTPRRRDACTLVGTCPAAWPGQEFRAEGHWVRHPQHGLQFTASRIVCVEPCSEEGIRRYLASGLIKGIGDVLAERLVAKFGRDTLRVIDRESALLLQVDGVGPKRREQIKLAWQEQKAVQEIMLFLHTHGVGNAQAARIHRQYGDGAIAIIKENPYRLAGDIWGIGFKTADKIAGSVGVPRDSLLRARAGIAYTLQCFSEEGHCHVPRAELEPAAASLLDMPVERVREGLALEVDARGVIEDELRIYLAPLYYAEIGVANSLRRLRAAALPFAIAEPGRAIEWAEGRMRIRFAPGQAAALQTALQSKVSIITGGPGVGKTTIIRALADILGAKRLDVCLAAPTGRAAKRMQEATGRPAMTLHRLLKSRPNTREFEHGPSNPLPADAYILDEVSMIDVVLMNAFLRALPDRAWLVLVGDADQLPSVGPGNVMRDLLDSGAIPASTLDVIFRQGDRSWIVHNAHRINRGEPLDLPPRSEASDFYFIEASEPDDVIRRVLALIRERIPSRFGIDPKSDIQVLTPMRRNQLGSENLNLVLQEAVNPGAGGVSRFGRVFRGGDRVMQMRNNYDKDVFNGDIGFVRSVDEADRTVRVDFDGRLVDYDFVELDELSLAYACSIHKSQGSEHAAVIIVMTTQHYKLLQRNLLYTAVTRGRRLVCLVGSSKAVRIAIRNKDAAGRQTGLRERLTLDGRQ